MKNLTFLILILASATLFAQRTDRELAISGETEQPRFSLADQVGGSSFKDMYQAEVLSDSGRLSKQKKIDDQIKDWDVVIYDSGPIITHRHAGPGYSHLSMVQDTSLGMSTYGVGAQWNAGNSLADDFVVSGGWGVSQIVFYAYQTGSGPPSTINDVRVQVYDGNPSAGGEVIFGDLYTNVLLSTEWTNTYRVKESDINQDRPIMRVVAETGGLWVNSGTYWVEFQVGGAGASGPWVPYVTLLGETTTGNAIQHTSTGWAPLEDVGPQGIPFRVEGWAYDFIDITINEISEPSSGTNLTSEENITIILHNESYIAVTDVPIEVFYYNSNFSASFFDTLPGPFEHWTTTEVTLSQTLDLSAYDDYVIEACAFYPADQIPGNNCKTKYITNAPSEPQIEIDPLEFTEAHTNPPQITTQTLAISNSGNAPLTWSLNTGGRDQSNKPTIFSPQNRAVIWDNGPLITAEGVGSNGSDYSELQDASLGMGTFGFNCQISAGNTLADDFEIAQDWHNLATITFYAYQTGSGPPSTINDVRFQIYDGDPSAGGEVIYGDLNTNRLLSTQWNNVWRVQESYPSENRSVMEIVADASCCYLTTGTYWLEFQANGIGPSGPWCPAVTIPGQSNTGNAMQHTTSGGWAPLVDNAGQGIPFVINAYMGGSEIDMGISAIPEPTSGVGGYTNEEPVTIKLENFGATGQSYIPFEVSWSGPIGNQTVSSVYESYLMCGQSVEITLDETADLSAPGTYVFEACTQMEGDENPDNDCKTKVLVGPEPGNDWLSFDLFSGVINPGDTTPVNVTFDSQVLIPGVYSDTITLQSNDPDNPLLSIPVVLNVVNELIPPVNLSAELLAAGEVQLAWSYNFTKDLEHFNMYRDDELIGTSQDTLFTDNLPDFGTYTYKVTAQYSEGESEPAGPVEVNWEALPEIGVDPMVLTETHNCTPMITTQTLTISNAGEVPIDWELYMVIRNSLGSPAKLFNLNPGNTNVKNLAVDHMNSENEPRDLAEQNKVPELQDANKAIKGHSQSVLWNNGPFITNEGAGTNGSDYSEVQDVSLGMQSLGFFADILSETSVADDFEVDDYWNISAFTFYAFKGWEMPLPTFTETRLSIYDGNPNEGGSVIWWRIIKDSLVACEWTNAWRVYELAPEEENAIMEITCLTPGLILSPGTYWVQFAFYGTGGTSSRVVPITINGETTTGNALQHNASGWTPLVDVGPQGIPFTIEGSITYSDVGVVDILEPAWGWDLSNTEPIVISIHNFGGTPQTVVPYQVSWSGPTGSGSISGTYIGNIEFGETVEVTSDETVNLFVYGDYSFDACTQLEGDQFTENNCTTKIVSNLDEDLPWLALYTDGCELGDGIIYWEFNNVLVPEIPCEIAPPSYEPWYHDYKDQIHSLEPGKTYLLTVQAGFDNTYFDVWINYNDDWYAFNDELILDDGFCGFANQEYTFEVTIPETATPGLHTLRFRTNYGQPVTHYFSTLTYGNCCDFTAYISDIPGWLEVNTIAGSVGPGESEEVTVTFNSQGLTIGNYLADIFVASRDPLNPLIEIPVELNVEEGEISYTWNPESFYFYLWGLGDEETKILEVTNISPDTISCNLGVTFLDTLEYTSVKGYTNYEFSKTSNPDQFLNSDQPGQSDAISCPYSSIISQPPVNFTTAYNMDEGAGYTIYQSVSLDVIVNGIRFWTISAFYDGIWSSCDGINPRPFDIGFWEDNNGMPGTNIAMFENMEISRIATGDMFGGTFPVYEYTVTFTPTIILGNSWFSIQSKIGLALDCWNLILNEPGGQGEALQFDGSLWTQQTVPVGFCLVGLQYIPWLNVLPDNAVILPGESHTFAVKANTFSVFWGMNWWLYGATASIRVETSGPCQNIVEIPVLLEIEPGGVDELNGKPNIEIFPNPTNNVVNISSNYQMYSLILLSHFGEIILEEKADGNSATIQTAGLPQGIYFIKINSETGESFHKLIVN